MKRFAIALALGLGAAAPAYAVTTSIGDINTPTAPSGFAPGGYYEDFNDGNAAGFSANTVVTGTNHPSGGDALYSEPANDPTPYYAVGPSTVTPQTLSISGFNKVSLYWGSLDSYNTITFLGLGTSFAGSAFQEGFGNGLVSRQVTFDFTPAEAALITGIQFSSSTNAFEFDNLSVGNAVPEPSVWAMMMMGLGLVGGALRRRAASAVTGVLGIA